MILIYEITQPVYPKSSGDPDFLVHVSLRFDTLGSQIIYRNEVEWEHEDTVWDNIGNR